MPPRKAKTSFRKIVIGILITIFTSVAITQAEDAIALVTSLHGYGKRLEALERADVPERLARVEGKLDLLVEYFGLIKREK